MRTRLGLVTALALALGAPAAWGVAPPPPRELTAVEQREVEEREASILRHGSAGEFEEAARVAGQVAEYRLWRQGASHWEVRDARLEEENWRRLTRVRAEDRAELGRGIEANSEGDSLNEKGSHREAEAKYRQALKIFTKVLGEQHPDTATGYNDLAVCLDDQGNYDKALPLFRKALEIRRKALGELHPDTATSYYDLAACLDRQGKRAEALPAHRKALEIREKALGELHPDTAASYNNVAVCLDALGKYAEALPVHRHALELRQKVLGEQNPDTANSYNNLAACLDRQGKRAEALPLFRKALEIRQKALGEQDSDTAISYNNLAACLDAQGKRAEALPLFRKALEIRRKALGEQHPDTAIGYNNVAYCLRGQGRYSQALPLHRKALEIQQKVLGEHPITAISYNNVALCLDDQGKHAEALPLHRKALEIRQKVLGELHPDTALGYNNVAFCLDRQGKRAEALPLHRKALEIRRKALGEQHPDTAASCKNVAFCLNAEGKYAEAARYWEAALLGFESGRLLASESGFDRARFGAQSLSPRLALAACLVVLGKPVQAWEHAESDLARGLLDDLTLGGGKEDEDASRLDRLRRLDGLLLPLLTAATPTAEQRQQQATLTRERDALVAELARSAARRARQRVFPLPRIQKALPPDAAVVFWLDVLDRHLGCVLRHEGEPAWVALPGSGKDDAWAAEDGTLAGRTLAALAEGAGSGEQRHRLVSALFAQRLAPLEPHLKGVRRLLVVPAGRMAAVPVEALTDDYVVSYLPSATLFARAAEGHRPLQGSSALVLADPAFQRPKPKLPDPPPNGLLVKAVLPRSVAARAGLRPGDVLLAYKDKELRSPEDLREANGDAPVHLEWWRDGKTLAGRVTAGKLGVAVDPRPLAEALAARRKEPSALLAASRGGEWQPLPGTRVEARALAALVPGATLLLGSDASEQRLAELAASGELARFRLLHLATHGEAHPGHPTQTALILARDRLPADILQADALAVLSGKKPLDGRLTVGALLSRDWPTLDADLAVLSACQTGLGQDAGGEGMLGFGQALLRKGARSVLLSRWKVDDAATALLMDRFYRNLLGRRAGLKGGLGRAEALAEARRWLRDLPRSEAEGLLARLVDGVPRGERGSVRPALPTRDEKPAAEVKGGDDRPFAAPYFWAAFVLLGDPD